MRDRCEANFVLPVRTLSKKILTFWKVQVFYYNLIIVIGISYQYFVQQYKQCNSYKLNMQTVQLDIQIKVRYIFSKMMANELVISICNFDCYYQ